MLVDYHYFVQMLAGCRDLLDEAKDYHLMPDRRGKLHMFKTRPRCCSDVAGVIFAVGGLTSLGNIIVNHFFCYCASVSPVNSCL